MSTPATVHAPAEKTLRVSLPKVTIAMLFCGIVSAAGIGAASAAVSDEDVPSLAVKFRPAESAHGLGSTHGVPPDSSSPPSRCARRASAAPCRTQPFVQCRAQSITRAVMKINNSEARRDSTRARREHG